jgi:hypothetical protein
LKAAQTKPIGSYFPGNTLALGVCVFLISPANDRSERGSPKRCAEMGKDAPSVDGMMTSVDIGDQ